MKLDPEENVLAPREDERLVAYPPPSGPGRWEYYQEEVVDGWFKWTAVGLRWVPETPH